MTHEQQIDALIAEGKIEEAARYYDLHIAVPF